ncbi:uncharacterized protein EAE97_010424 [Botrytis byssoidea]|uniref:Uncharacterized protein n=1 Tax=Botrytis byssoidea TaxID=139641 RepID=A0A9P5I3T3_9HELO|nr:uncharacterized protein EAE97_010424 [Botrytis byssoidea]KAF7926124.1 hypothetical protein EAE97_010424 [Botrytis byssoidea]
MKQDQERLRDAARTQHAPWLTELQPLLRCDEKQQIPLQFALVVSDPSKNWRKSEQYSVPGVMACIFVPEVVQAAGLGLRNFTKERGREESKRREAQAQGSSSLDR